MICGTLLRAALALIFISASCFGQSFVNGSITGTVTDNTGGNVAVTLTNLGTNVKLVSQTDDDGRYRLFNI